ncbi:RHS repeat domain-containing protein [Chryseobacterium flavum]|uniref:RHS repeat domain-containing protein n=1 Tax=Chryseobacterium flavum TaxID=415851 RepID=UPI0028B1B0C8|nr:RHS repeat-associated core domain-containing protein [Chryseobacterium flavum]
MALLVYKYSFTENRYIYQYKDHLGNAKVNYAKNNAGVLEITDSNNYYPFGLNHIGGGKGLLGGYRNYKYNGKELQETGMYDYGAKFYMPDIGRWPIVDPRSQYTHETYSYVWNNSILFNDPAGMEGETGKCPPNCPNGVSAINISPNGQKETTIQEIILTGKAADNSSGPGSLAMATLIVSQADSPAPGPADIVAAGMLIGAGAWWTWNQFAPLSIGYQPLQTQVQE